MYFQLYCNIYLTSTAKRSASQVIIKQKKDKCNLITASALGDTCGDRNCDMCAQILWTLMFGVWCLEFPEAISLTSHIPPRVTEHTLWQTCHIFILSYTEARNI